MCSWSMSPLNSFQLTTCLKKLTTTYGSMRAVLSLMKALVTLAMMLELFLGRPSARYTFTQKRAHGRSEGNPSGIIKFLTETAENSKHLRDETTN